MTDDPVILVCAAATFIAFATVFYIFLDEVRRYRALRQNFENEIAAERAVRESESVHHHSGV